MNASVTELQVIRRDCAQKRWEYQIARWVYVEVTRLSVPDRSAVESELRAAMMAYYAAHGALHSALRARQASPLH